MKRRSRYLLSLIVAGFGIMVLNGCGTWNIDEICSGSRPSLALIPTSDTAHISYFDGNYLALATQSVTWSTEVVDDGSMPGEESEPENAGSLSSLAIDASSDYPKIAYLAYTEPLNYHLRYAEWTGVGWAIEVVREGSDDSHIADVSLELDIITNEPRIAFVEDVWADDWAHLFYAEKIGGTWIIEDVARVSGSPGISLALTPDNEPRISFRRDCHLDYARRIDGEWTFETISSVADSGYESSLEIASDGTPYVCFRNGILSPTALVMATRSAGSWTMHEVASEAQYGGCSLAISPTTDMPAISFYNKDSDDLHFVLWDGSDWTIERVASTEGITIHHSLSVASSLVFSLTTGVPRIAYSATDEPRKRIHYATGE